MDAKIQLSSPSEVRRSASVLGMLELVNRERQYERRDSVEREVAQVVGVMRQRVQVKRLAGKEEWSGGDWPAEEADKEMRSVVDR